MWKTFQTAHYESTWKKDKLCSFVDSFISHYNQSYSCRYKYDSHKLLVFFISILQF